MPRDKEYTEDYLEDDEEVTAEAERDLRAAVEGEDTPASEPLPDEPRRGPEDLADIPASEPAPAPKTAALTPYPTEEPGDPTVMWSPRPGIVGCKRRGYQKIK